MPEEPFDAVTYLASKGHRGKPVSGAEVVYACFMDCNLPDDSKKKKWYLNQEDGFYSCKVCGAAGGSYLLQKFFGEEPARNVEPHEDPLLQRKIRNWAADVGSAMLANNDEMLMYLMDERGLSPETILERKLGWVGKGWSLTGSLPEDFPKKALLGTGLVYRDGHKAGQDFFFNHILIPYVSRGNVLQIRGKVHGAKYFTGPGDPARIYNLDDLADAEDVIITEGEFDCRCCLFDCMALKQHLQSAPDDRTRAIAVVGLPGAKKLSDDQLKYFAAPGLKRIYIALDPDDTGKRVAVELKEQLGTRARIVELPPELPKCDWTDFLLPVPAGADASWHLAHPHAGHDWRDVMALLGNASGKRIFSMRESGMAYRSQRDDGVLIKTGFLQLDATIGGMKPGQVMVVLAKTGTGKTVLLCNMAYNMREQKVLLISLEMTREEVYERMRRIFLFHNPLATDAQLEDAMSNIWICDENRLGEKDLNRLVDEFEIESGVRPDVVMVDYLGYYARGAAGNSPYEKTTNAVMQLKAEAKAGRFVCVSPAQVNRGTKEGKPIDLDDARDSGAIEETADFLLSIWRPDDALMAEATNMQQSGKIKLTILKSRHGGKDRTFTLVMDLLTLVMVDDGTQAAKRCGEHNYLAWRGEKWEDLRRVQLAPVQQTIAYRRDLQ